MPRLADAAALYDLPGRAVEGPRPNRPATSANMVAGTVAAEDSVDGLNLLRLGSMRGPS